MNLIKSKFMFAIVILFLVLAITFFVRNEPANTNSENNIGSKEDSKVTLEELKKHNDMESCWVPYNGKVYDLTAFLPGHPGRPERILPYCGTTGFQEAFERKHGTSKVDMLMSVGTFMGDLEVVGSLN